MSTNSPDDKPDMSSIVDFVSSTRGLVVVGVVVVISLIGVVVAIITNL